MRAEDGKGLVRRFLVDGLGGLDPAVVDEVFDTNHVLTSPEFGTRQESGTGVIKAAIEEFREAGGGVTCTVERQIAEGDWVATSYTLTQGAGDHMGIMISRASGGKIVESHVVARDVSAAESASGRKAFN